MGEGRAVVLNRIGDVVGGNRAEAVPIVEVREYGGTLLAKANKSAGRQGGSKICLSN